MFGCTDLKAAMALCWKTVWKVDPLPLTVPESLVLGADVGAAGEAVVVAVVVAEDDLLLLPHAANKRPAARIGSPTARIRGGRRRGVGGAPGCTGAGRWIDKYPSERFLTVSSLA
jgi:hypothetical protein